MSAAAWPSVLQLAVSLAVGVLVGLERRSAHKDIGVRTFGGVALVFTVAWAASPRAAYDLLLLLIPVVAAVNVRSFIADRSLELTTSVAMLSTALLGILAAQGQLLAAAACGIVITALLAWKAELGRFAQTVTVDEIRGALLLGMIAFVIYPLLPAVPVDPWGLLDLRDAWVAVLAISGIGFVNYVLLRLWGARGIGWTGLLGGVVNSKAVAVELCRRARADPGRLWPFATFGMLTANVAMVLRNALILAIFAPDALRRGWLPLGAMFMASVAVAATHRVRTAERVALTMDSPVSLRHVGAFGAVFLAIGVLGGLAQRLLGHAGFLAVAVAGGIVSSASSSAVAATLAGQGRLVPEIAAYGVALASITNLVSNIPAVHVVGRDHAETRRIAILSGVTVAAGLGGLLIQMFVPLHGVTR